MPANLEPDACYRALVAHDPRFDGAFFVGVRTTGVYCRPVCRARTPRRDSCEFFARAVQAEKAGYRACFRCRPERAPGSALAAHPASVDAGPALVRAAMRKIEEGALNEASVDDLAASLGVSARHLRRVIREELGVGPLELALSRKVAVARELLLGTPLSVTEVAFASGFSSVRRFNALYRSHQHMTPSEVRRPSAGKAGDASTLRLVLDVRPPFDATHAFAFLRARAVTPNESFAKSTYRKGVRLVDAKGMVHQGVVEVEPAATRTAIVVRVSSSLAPMLMSIAARVRRVFDTDADVSVIGAHLSKDPSLRALVRRRPGLRVPGAFDPFEWATRAVLGQQVSVRAARTLAGRLVERFGVRVSSEGPLVAWPDAHRLASTTVEELAAIGVTKARAKTLHALATAVATRNVVLDRDADPKVAIDALGAVPGIGSWTADYIALRSLAWPDAFPAGDLVLRKALGGLSEAECETRSRAWSPWRAYAAAHLWAGTTEDTDS